MPWLGTIKSGMTRKSLLLKTVGQIFPCMLVPLAKSYPKGSLAVGFIYLQL